MPTLITNYNWGSSKDFNQGMFRQLSEAYTDTANIMNTKVSKYFTNGDVRPHVNPPASSEFNKNFEIGDIFVRTDTNTAWIMTSRTTSDDVIWTQIT